MIIKIKRQAAPDTAPYYSIAEYSGDGSISVADWLSAANADSFSADRIAGDCACLERRCGACAMRINGRPALACAVLLRDAVRGGETVIEPLEKFPVIKDLAVDRSAMFAPGADRGVTAPNGRLKFSSAQCLMCGCCLDICPVYSAGGSFLGAAGIVHKYLAGTLSSADLSPCLRCFACIRVCPQGIPIRDIFDTV